MKNKILFLVLGCFLAACGPSGNKPVDIAVILKGINNPYWTTLEDGVMAAASKSNIKVAVQGVQNDQEAEQQLNLCETVLSRNPKALIFAAINNVNLVPCLKKAQQQGVLLVDVDGSMSPEDNKRAGINVAFSVASNNTMLGKKAAEYLADQKGKVLIIEGVPGSLPSQRRVSGFKENLSENLNIIASLPGNWDRLRAANITSDILARHPDLTAIFAANDSMALGAAETLRVKSVTDIQVIGVDGIADAVVAIKKDRLTATIAQLPFLMGKQAIEKTHNLIIKKTAMSYNQYVPVLTLDKEMLSANKEPFLKYVK